MSRLYLGKNKFLVQIISWAEERDEFFFACVFMFERGEVEMDEPLSHSPGGGK